MQSNSKDIGKRKSGMQKKEFKGKSTSTLPPNNHQRVLRFGFEGNKRPIDQQKKNGGGEEGDRGLH